MRRVAAAVALALGGIAVVRASQTAGQAPLFRTGTDTVAIYATVLDLSGEMVTNLQRDDFDVYDDGRRQTLTTFVNGLQPITAALLMDTSASMTLNLDLAQTAAEQFVIRMLPGDRVRVGSFSDRVDLSPGFTTDRDSLLRSLRNDLHIGNPTKLWDAVDETMTSLQPLGGRRVILLFTDGVDTASQTTAEAVLQRARTDELMVYLVQFRSTPLAMMAELPLSPSASDLLRERPVFAGPPGADVRQLADQTGGGRFLLTPADDVNATFTEVMQELHYQYILGFTPEHVDGRIHELHVRVRRPNLTVRARHSYLAARPKPG